MNRVCLAALSGAAALLASLAPGADARSADAPFNWYTPAFAARVDAAGAVGVPVPPGGRDDIPASSISFTGIRPGTWLLVPPSPAVTDIRRRCTANFVYQDASGGFDPSREVYIGTAAHCVTFGQDVHAVVAAPGDATALVVRIGTVVLDATAEDAALVQIDSALRDWVSPSAAHWGGPTGIYPGPGNVPAVITGHGLVFGETGTPRAGLLSLSYIWNGPAADGDSGAPIITSDGLAAGHLFGVTTGREIPEVGRVDIGVSSQVRSVQSAIAASGKSLVTCPTRTPWPLPGCPVA